VASSGKGVNRMVRPDPNYQPGDVKAVFNPETGITSNFFDGRHGEQAVQRREHLLGGQFLLLVGARHL
jgi:hypothetical protein